MVHIGGSSFVPPATTLAAGTVKQAADSGAPAAQTQGAPVAQGQVAIVGTTTNITPYGMDSAASFANLRTAVEAAKTDVANVKTDVAAIKTDVAALVSEVGTIRNVLRSSGEMA